MITGNRRVAGVVASAVLCVSLMHAAGVVAVDQAGYRIKDAKAAYLTAPTDSFQIIDAASRAVVFRGAPAVSNAADAATGMSVWKAEFTSLERPGEYFLKTSVGDSSQRFFIADTVYNVLYQKSLKGFYYQRCGMALTPAVAEIWNHSACHVAGDGYFHASAESTGFAAVAGGWHDAGDYGKYVVNAGISVGTLLMAYEWFPAKFSSDGLQIPESGNGVPDLLDETRYELTWLLKMQSANGGVFHKVTKKDFEGFILPQFDGGNRYIYQISSTATGDFAAMMARAARVYRPFDTTFANRCLSAAVKAWEYLLAHSSIVPATGFKNPSDTQTGVYGDGDDSDERLWAAAEIYLTTGDGVAHSYYTANYASRGVITGTMGWSGVRPLAQCAYLRGIRSGINTTIQGQIRQSLLTYAGTILGIRNTSGFRTALRSTDYYWGSNSQVLNNAILLILSNEEGGPLTHRDAALDQIHYILGANAHNLSFVTGIGGRRVMRPHHRPSGSDGVLEPVPGLVSGGPNRNITEDPVLQSLFTSSTPPALCFVDDQGSYASNEICINWNAPLVFVAGYFSGTTTPTCVGPREKLNENGFRLDQNYPNPFNGSTNLSFFLSSQGEVDLLIYDVLGRVVLQKNLGEYAAGQHRVIWSARDRSENPLSSGVYFYCILGRQRSGMQRLVLLN